VANEYVSVSDFKSTVNLAGENFADPDITRALTAASRAVDFATGRRFWIDADANQVRYYSPAAADALWVDDIVTLTTLEVDLGGDGTFEETWTLNTDFTLEPLNAAADSRPWESIRVHPRSGRYFALYPRSVKVTAKFGWAAVPDGIKEATTLVASRLVKRKREAPFGVAGIGFDGSAVRIATTDPDVAMLLAPFTRHVYA